MMTRTDIHLDAMRLIWDGDGVVDVISLVGRGTGALADEHEAANAALDRGDSVRSGAP